MWALLESMYVLCISMHVLLNSVCGLMPAPSSSEYLIKVQGNGCFETVRLLVGPQNSSLSITFLNTP